VRKLQHHFLAPASLTSWRSQPRVLFRSFLQPTSSLVFCSHNSQLATWNRSFALSSVQRILASGERLFSSDGEPFNGQPLSLLLTNPQSAQSPTPVIHTTCIMQMLFTTQRVFS